MSNDTESKEKIASDKTIDSAISIEATPRPVAPPNYTKSLEDLKKENDARIAIKEKEDAERKAAIIKRASKIFMITGLICLVLIIIWMIKSNSDSKYFQEEQSKVNEAVSEYIKADTEIAKQVRTNLDAIVKINSAVSEHDKRIASLEAQIKKVDELTPALNKTSKLAIMNRNRLYIMMMKDNPNIEAAFEEEELDGDVIQAYSDAVVLAMAKAIEEKHSKEKSDNKEKSEKNKEPEDHAGEPEVKIVVPDAIIPETVPNPPETTKESLKKDYLIIIKPWKWRWFRCE